MLVYPESGTECRVVYRDPGIREIGFPSFAIPGCLSLIQWFKVWQSIEFRRPRNGCLSTLIEHGGARMNASSEPRYRPHLQMPNRAGARDPFLQ